MIAEALGLHLGTTQFPFAGNYSEVGLYAYGPSSTFAGVAFFGLGPEDQMHSALICPKYRPGINGCGTGTHMNRTCYPSSRALTAHAR